ncbi:hypothetical protein EJA70_02575 [Pseudomonas sp. PB103]|nr:hypothetical protein EJA70_02575 [Pseudomonas sp. PB103]
MSLLAIAECQSANELPDTPPSRAGSLLHLLCGDLQGARHNSGVNIHTMTIRRLLVLSSLRNVLFFYSQLKDIDSITGSSQSPRGG